MRERVVQCFRLFRSKLESEHASMVRIIESDGSVFENKSKNFELEVLWYRLLLRVACNCLKLSPKRQLATLSQRIICFPVDIFIRALLIA